MIFIETFKKFKENIIIVIYPIIFDLIALFVSLSVLGFYGESMLSSRLILEMGLPSVSQISNIPFFINNIDFFNVQVELPNHTILIVLAFLIVGAFIQGSYIGHLQAIATDQEYNFSKFKSIGRRNWIQFIILELMVFFGKVLVATIFISFYEAIGGFIALAIFFVLRILFIYLEMTMVVDRLGVAQAFSKSRLYFKKSILTTIALIFTLYLVSSGASLVLHWFWSEATLIISIIIYALIMSFIQLTFMMTLCQTKEDKRITL